MPHGWVTPDQNESMAKIPHTLCAKHDLLLHFLQKKFTNWVGWNFRPGSLQAENIANLVGWGLSVQRTWQWKPILGKVKYNEGSNVAGNQSSTTEKSARKKWEIKENKCNDLPQKKRKIIALHKPHLALWLEELWKKYKQRQSRRNSILYINSIHVIWISERNTDEYNNIHVRLSIIMYIPPPPQTNEH